MLLLEHFFSAPTDVLAASLSILLLIAPLHEQLADLGAWYHVIFYYNAAMAALALMALLLLNKDYPDSSFRNNASRSLHRFCAHFGNGRLLFLMLFLLTTVFYVKSSDREFIWLLFYSAIVITIDPKHIAFSRFCRFMRSAIKMISESYSVCSLKIYSWQSYTNNTGLYGGSTLSFSNTLWTKRARLCMGSFLITIYLMNSSGSGS